MNANYYPQVGDHLYLSQRIGNHYVDMVKRPYTVIGVSKSKITIQSAKLIFNGPRYYDTLPDDIVEDKEGEILTLNWAPKKGRWQNDEYKTGYPSIAYFSGWEYFPYLD